MIINQFKDFLEFERNYSSLTVQAYVRDVESFAAFYKETYAHHNFADANYPQIRQWIVGLVEKGLSNRSVNRKGASLKAFYAYLHKVGVLQINPMYKHKACLLYTSPSPRDS